MNWRAMLLLALSALQLSCALVSEVTGPREITPPNERVFYEPFDDVWRATMMALQSPKAYPLAVANMDSAIIETTPIKGSQAWVQPLQKDPVSSGYSYKLNIHIIRGDVDGKPACKVVIRKEGQIQRDFFSPSETLSSDGLEEQVLLYRIERELQIDRALKRAHERKSKTSG